MLQARDFERFDIMQTTSKHHARNSLSRLVYSVANVRPRYWSLVLHPSYYPTTNPMLSQYWLSVASRDIENPARNNGLTRVGRIVKRCYEKACFFNSIRQSIKFDGVSQFRDRRTSRLGTNKANDRTDIISVLLNLDRCESVAAYL